MNTADVRLLFEYNDWANRLILAKSAEVTPEQWDAPTTHSWGSLHGTVVHILRGEHRWRMIFEIGEVPADGIKPEDFPTVESVRERWTVEQSAWHTYLNDLTDADMSRMIRYSTKVGVSERVLWHCLFHIVNHGTQHRSEAAHMLTQYGHSPGDIDFTLYLVQH